MKAPPEAMGGSGVLTSFYVQNGPDDSRSLTDPQRIAADFNPGSHLVAGEIVKRRICPSGWLEGTAQHDLPLRILQGKSSVDPRHGLDLSALADGVNAYPAPSIGSRAISRADMGGDL